MFSQETKWEYEENIPNTLSEKGTIDVEKNLHTMNSFSVMRTRDTIYNMSEGFYSSKLRVHDIYDKKLKDYSFNYLDNFANDIHTEGGSSAIITESVDTQTGKRLKTMTIPNYLFRQQVTVNIFNETKIIHIRVTI